MASIQVREIRLGIIIERSFSVAASLRVIGWDYFRESLLHVGWYWVLGWSEQTNVWIQKYAKSCCHKTTWAIILMTPIHLLEASGAPAFTLQQGGWITHRRRSRSSWSGFGRTGDLMKFIIDILKKGRARVRPCF